MAVALLVAACWPETTKRGIGFINQTGQAVRVTYVVAGVERPVEGETEGDVIPNGTSSAYELDLFAAANADHCTTGDIVIRTLDGREVKRLTPPICGGTWHMLE